jgi:hypothetical protein
MATVASRERGLGRATTSAEKDILMQICRAIVVGAIALAAAPACTGSGGSSPTQSGSDDIASYQRFVAEVGSAAATYEEDMLGAGMTTVATCQGVHDQYDADVRPQVIQMGAMSGGMDTFMGERGGGDRADVGCATADMLSELDRHHAVACQLADLPADQAEAVRHVGVMTSLATHLLDRSDQMAAALDGAGGSFGPMMHGCEDWDGAAMMHEGR